MFACTCTSTCASARMHKDRQLLVFNLMGCHNIRYPSTRRYYGHGYPGTKFLPVPALITRQQISDSSKLKEFADNNFKFDKNCRKLYKRVESTGKRRNCSLRAISPFPTVFSKGLFPWGT